MPGWVMPSKKKGQKTFPIGEELVGFETLTPSQIAMSAKLKSLIAGAGGPGFGGGAAAAFTPFTGAVGGALESALMSALRGEVPTAAFEAGVARPARRTFEEETAPAIREEFAGPGTFWGTARAGEVTGRRERMETGIGEQRARMVEGALQRALQATGPALAAQQSAIQLAFQDYVRKYPAASEALQAALSYLGIPMMAAYQPYEETGGATGKTWGTSKLAQTLGAAPKPVSRPRMALPTGVTPSSPWGLWGGGRY